MRILEFTTQHVVAEAHRERDLLAGDAVLDDVDVGAVAREPPQHGTEFHEGVAAAGRQLVQGTVDLVVRIHPDSADTAFGEKAFHHRLAGVALLHPDSQACQVCHPSHRGMAGGVHRQGLPGPEVRRAERGPLPARPGDSGAGGHDVEAPRDQLVEDRLEVVALVRDELPAPAETPGKRLGEIDVESDGPVPLVELERWVGHRRSHPKRGSRGGHRGRPG